jgi:4-carboxymuconolactone decarboxylase
VRDASAEGTIRVARLPGTQGSGDISARIRDRRGGTLRPLDEQLLHSPEVADGWNSLLGAIRSRATLAPNIRELVILRVAVLNRADYEWHAHRGPAIKAGVTVEQIAALQQLGSAVEATWDQTTRHVIAYVDAMTKDIQVPDDVFDAVQAHFSVAEIVELTATIAAYNMVSRFLVALQIELPTSEAVHS